MTTAQPDRLDRIEALVEANARAIAANSEAIAASNEQMAIVEQTMQRLGERTEIIALAVERMIDVQLQTFRVIEEMQAEVRGLQTENRRILDHLFGQE
jgi:hypothetical protein